jgi:alkylation response protein AidB-like acyl-CoA dehydrogenase
VSEAPSVDLQRAAVELERELGDPARDSSALSFRSAVELDEAERFPEESCARLERGAFSAHMVPVELGGRLRSLEELLAICRVVARRDLTVAIAKGQSLLGALPIWLGGTSAQRMGQAQHLLAGELGCLALTEEAHGSDLLATEVEARRCAGGFELHGRKWLINNGTLGTTASVLVRTGPSARDLSLIALDKAALPADTLRPVPKVRTLGIRGADISGLDLRGAPVAEGQLIGEPGEGLMLTLKTLQVSRTLCAGFSLGAADTALRVALDFAAERALYGGRVIDLPVVRGHLVDAFLDLLVCDCVARVTCRAIICEPQQMSLWSAIAKALVPSWVEQLIRECGVVLGARHYLRGHFSQGVFQKLLRDNAVVGLFDGSTEVNYGVIASQLGALSAKRPLASAVTDDSRARLHRLFSSATIVAEHFVRADELKLLAEGRDRVLEGLVSGIEANFDTPPPKELSEPIAALLGELNAIDRELAALGRSGDRKPGSQGRAALAQRYSLVFAGAACLLTWAANRGASGSFASADEWPRLALRRVLGRLGHRDPDDDSARSAAFSELQRLHRGGLLFSLVPFQLAQD